MKKRLFNKFALIANGKDFLLNDSPNELKLKLRKNYSKEKKNRMETKAKTKQNC